MTESRPTRPDEAEVERQLQQIQDPCSLALNKPMDIVKMGLIESIEVQDGHVKIMIILTDPNCFFFTEMERYINDVVVELPGVESVEVDISGKTLWSEDRIRKDLPVVSIGAKAAQ